MTEVKSGQITWLCHGRVYFKRGVQPKCGVQNEKCSAFCLKNGWAMRMESKQWRREGVCRPGQMSVLPPPPIRSVLQSGYFFRISDMGCEPTLGVPSSSVHSYSVRFPFPTPSPPLEAGPLNPARRPGERCKLRQWGLGQSPSLWPSCLHADVCNTFKDFHEKQLTKFHA